MTDQRVVRTATIVGLSLAFGFVGCNAGGGGGGGGGGGNTDPLAQYQLGDDPELDADVATIADADNEAADCIALNVTFEEQEVLDALKQGFPDDRSEEEFPEFVAETAPLAEAKTREICDTTLENASNELLELVNRMTEAGNQNNVCIGEEPDVTDEQSLRAIKRTYFSSSVYAFDSMEEAATVLVEETEEIVEENCAE